MSILSQIGIIILTGFILVVLFRSNKLTEQAAEEGEHFTDEWQIYQERKKELKDEKKAAKELKLEKKKSTKIKIQEEESKEALPSEKKEPESEEKTEKTDFVEKIDSADNIIKLHQSPSRQLTLVRMDANHYPVQKIAVDELPFTIGRGKQNSLVLDDLCVAREHCQIIEVSGNIILKDRGSANKIYTDGRTYEEITLYDRQRFYLGNEEFLVEMQEEPSSFRNYSMEA